MEKVELHAHTADDDVDWIPYSSTELIDRAASVGYTALAITLHERQINIDPLRSYAADRGVVLIPGIERSINGCHVLLLNFRSADTNAVQTFEDLARLKSRHSGLVIAPHPFFPSRTAVGRHLNANADLFDAVERNAMYTRSLDFNRRAERWAGDHRKPTVGAGDIHRLRQLDATYTVVDAEHNADSICSAIVAGRVRVESRPLTWIEAGSTMASILAGQLLPPRSKSIRQTSLVDRQQVGRHF